MKVVDQMKLFMEPKSVALVGVSRATGEGSFNILENLLGWGFSGKIYPINPHAEEILGVKAYPSVAEVPGEIDLAVIATPRSSVLSLVRECLGRGIKAIIIVAQGFADADEEGRALQAEVLRLAKEGGARILGPNTFGVLNAFNRFGTAFMPVEMAKVPVAVVCQSGLFFIGFPGFRLVGKGIDLGNGCDIHFGDVLEYLEDDPDIRLIVLHIEGIPQGRGFMEVARRVARVKPILALKVARSQAGAKAARSHTGSLAGRDEVYDAAFKQCGLLRVRDIDELEDLTKAFLHLPPIGGRKVGVLTITGGGGIMAVDACDAYGLEVSTLTTETINKVRGLFPSWMRVANPVDVWPASMISGHSYREVFRTILDALLADPEVDGVIFMTTTVAGEGSLEPWDILAQAQGKKDKPIVGWRYCPYVGEMASYLEGEGKIIFYPTAERAARALARLVEYGEMVKGKGEGGD